MGSFLACGKLSAINIVYMTIVAGCKSSEISIVNIHPCIDLIIEEEEEAMPHSHTDLDTWWLHIRRAFADLFKLPVGVSPVSNDEFVNDTNPTTNPPYHQLYWMSDSEHIQFEMQIGK